MMTLEQVELLLHASVFAATGSVEAMHDQDTHARFSV
jgi:hypothetical protein